MEKAEIALEQEIRELERLEQAAVSDLKNAPNGTLRIANRNGKKQYYWRVEPKDTEGKYIRKNEKKLAESLAQKDYARKVLAVLTPVIRKKKKILEFQETDVQEKILEVYEKLSEDRKNLVRPYLYAKEELGEKWECQKKLLKDQIGPIGKFSEVCMEIYTEKGECVRSKSEKILADKLYMMEIPYVYEAPLFVNEYGYVKPDFTVLNKRTRKEFYWEHLGMMDDREYCEKAIKKIESLEKSGIFPGINLIVTYETKRHPLNIKIVEKLARQFLI